MASRRKKPAPSTTTGDEAPSFGAIVRSLTSIPDADLRGFVAYPSDVGRLAATAVARAARVVLALRVASRLAEELRALEEPMLTPLRLAVEAARIVIEREKKLAPQRTALEKACRAILDASWEPAPFDRIGKELPTEPTLLRAAAAHRLLDRAIYDALVTINPSDADRSLDLQIARENEASAIRFRAMLRADAPNVLIDKLRVHRHHFPGDDEAATREAIAKWADPANGGHLEPSQRHARARREILAAWGCPESVLKHVERSIQRASGRAP